jgi:hypothetical protein
MSQAPDDLLDSVGRLLRLVENPGDFHPAVAFAHTVYPPHTARLSGPSPPRCRNCDRE